MRAAFVAALKEMLLDAKPHVIIWEYWFMTGFAECARQLAPSAIQVLDQIDVEWRRLHRQTQTERGIRACWTRWLWPRMRAYEFERYRLMDRVAAVTQDDAEAVHRLAPQFDRPYVLSMGLMLGAYPALGVGDSNRILYFYGSLRHAPNADALYFLIRDILPLLRRRCPDVALDVMGAHVPAWVGRVPNVRAIDFQFDMKSILNDAGVVIAPLRFGAGVKLKVLEAMAYGKAVVTTSVGAEGIDAVGGEALIAVDDARAIAMQAARLLRDPEARAAMGQRARAYVHRRHDAQLIAHGFIDELRRLCGIERESDE
jgi:hypothetical protein